MKAVLLPFLLGSFLLALPDINAGELRTWTSASDPTRTFEGEMVRLEGDNLSILRASDRKVFTLKLSQVSAEDRAYALKAAEVMPGGRPPEIDARTVRIVPLKKRPLPRNVEGGLINPAPVTPAPVTPAPVTPAPVTPAPVTPAPDPVVAAPDGPGADATSLLPKMAGRATPADQAKLMQAHGGTAESHNRVLRALNYLKSVQKEDGSWGDESYDAAMTGLALQCYFALGITLDNPMYGETVAKGLSYLITYFQKDAKIYATSHNHGRSYEHGIAVAALAEGYVFNSASTRKIPELKEALEKGVQIIIDGQNPDGGWSYGYPARGNSDTSVTGWQILALALARQIEEFPKLELKVEGLAESIEKAQNYLTKNQDPNNGMFPYRPGQAGKATLTGAGVLGLQSSGLADHKEGARRGLAAILDGMKGKNWENGNLYAWYFNTQATFNGGKEPWDQWNGMFRNEIVANQNTDGSWTHRSAKEGGGNVYATCLCTLMLQTYYRYLP